jgi:hypothetical protein
VGILSGATAVFAGAGVLAAWHANDLGDQVTTSFDKGGTWNTQAASLDREGRRAQTEAIVFLSAAALSGATAYLVHRLSATSSVH